MSQTCNFVKKEILAQVFSCEFCEISKNTFFHRTPLVAASFLIQPQAIPHFVKEILYFNQNKRLQLNLELQLTFIFNVVFLFLNLQQRNVSVNVGRLLAKIQMFFLTRSMLKFYIIESFHAKKLFKKEKKFSGSSFEIMLNALSKKRNFEHVSYHAKKIPSKYIECQMFMDFSRNNGK